MASAPIFPQPASIDDQLASLDKIPLFMKSLPSEGADDTAISALQSLAYEGTPDEIAQNFKDQGNDYFKGRRYREAHGFYSQGIDAKPTDQMILEALLCNRAACNLELKNYGSVLKDCSKAISINPRSSKAYYRSTLALVALDRLEEALDCCDRCLQFDPDNKDVQDARVKAADLEDKRDRKERERQEKLLKEKHRKQQLKKAFSERNLIIVSNPEGPSNNPYEPSFDPEDLTNNTLILPVFFLYPQYATSDLISHFVENTAFAAHLSDMFPPNAAIPEWDKNKEYVNGQLAVYAMTHRKRLLKVGKKTTLEDVCKAARGKDGEPKDGLELKDGCLTFVVLPKGEVEQRWVEDYKRARDS
ncbi:Hsp70/Hsp90 co-chaperone CNS1 [Grifola frondosa]|uniref:Hsp70/Hsp90 co-chaperone CNS1 n=1 Tax=Grifola frondosa TaxID=5627 RepID=A0A1C7MJX8_GRIFR|nr:Hsp70/Hsp90 co-chaperone CNS1 [Grifola frondosa]